MRKVDLDPCELPAAEGVGDLSLPPGAQAPSPPQVPVLEVRKGRLDAFDDRAAPTEAPVVTINRDGGAMKRRMSELKMLLPVMSAMIYRPGLVADAGEKLVSINTMIAAIERDTATVMKALSENETAPRWIAGPARAIAAEWVADRWRQHGDTETADVVRQATKIVASGEVQHWTEGQAAIDYRKATGPDDGRQRLRLSLLKAISPLFASIETFSFHLPAAKVQGRMAALILSVSASDNDAADISADLDIARRQGNIGRAGELAGVIYRRYAERTIDRMLDIEKNGTRMEADGWVNANAEKLMEAIERDTRRAFDNLHAIANRLIESESNPERNSDQ